MVPKSEKVVLALAAKEKMSMFEKSEGRVVRDVGAAEWSSVASQGNAVLEKKHLSVQIVEAENTDISITDGVNHGGADNGDTTDEPSGSLSSFDDTVSSGDGGLGMSDGEINSEFSAFPGFEDAFRMRKKKVTDHWRNFIRPIMWRCKWAEIQMKKLQIQASVYGKLLEEFDQARQAQKENFDAETQCSRTLPFPHQMKRRKIMRRIKRKRVEDATDVASYMQQHNLFAFYENKGTLTDHAHLTNEYPNPVTPAVRNGGTNLVDNEVLVHFDDEETSVERILSKIYSMQSQVHHLTTRVDKVVNENHGRFSSLDKLSLLTTPSNSGASTGHDPTPSVSDKHEVLITSPIMINEHASEHHIHEGRIPVIPITTDQVADSLPSIPETVDQPVAEDKLDNAGLKEHLNTSEMQVYRRGSLAGKKRKTLSDNQSNGSSSTPRKEKSSVFLASRYASLLNNQKKRGKRKGRRPGSGKRTFEES